MRSSRIQPAMPIGAYKSYEIRTPRATHWRKATCDEYDCANFLNGWVTLIDLTSELGKQQDYYIQHQSGRSFRIEDTGPGQRRFIFEPGQPCFDQDKHMVPIGRPELYIVRDGDWRGNPTRRTRTHARGADWVEDFAEHQIRVAEQMNRG